LSFVATKTALRDVSPVTLIFSRFALGLAVLFTILKLRRQLLTPPPSMWPMLALMGFVGVFVHQMLQAHALKLTTAVRTGWLIGLIPIWSVVLAVIFLGERLGPRLTFGLLLGAIGALLVITRGELSLRVLSLPATRGDLLILASTVNWAIYSVIGRRTLKALGSGRATAFSILAGWAMIVPFFLLSAGWRDYRCLSTTGAISILFLGIGCSGVAYLLWYVALEHLETARVAVFLYVEPLVTVTAALLLLGEPILVTTIVGGLLVLAGVFFVQKNS
jgi:drug/metabolite transporter (DMT)-like permease